MKLADWVWSKSRDSSSNALRLAMWLVGLPFLLTFAFIALRAFDTPPPQPVASVQRWIEHLSGVRYDTAGFTALAARQPDLSDARWTTVTLPDVIPIPPISETTSSPIARAWMRLQYTLPADASPPLQLAVHVTRIMAGPWTVWVDGKLIDADLEDWRMQWNVPLFVKLPAGSVVPGRPVTIDVAFPYRVSQGYAMGSMYIGPADAIQRLNQTRVFWQNTLPKAAILITLLLGLLALQHWLGDKSDRAHLMMAFVAIIWFLANTQYFGDFLDDAASLWFSALNDAATSWLLCALTLFSIQFDGERWPRLEMSLILYSVAVTLITLPSWNWGVYALTFQHYVDVSLTLSIFIFFTWRSYTRGSTDFKIIMTAVWSMPIMGLHNLYYLTAQRAPDGIHLFPYSTFIVFGAFLYVMQRRYVQARRQLVEINTSLDERLRQREAELDVQHRRLMAGEQQRAIFDERQRIMRDMHDGIGTTLMSSLTQAEHGQLDPAQVKGVLRETLDELKLVIDSLEPVGQDLAVLLANLRYRFGQRVEAAGVRIIWEMDQLPPLPWLDPSAALQVLRIVQEAVINVVKHANATEVRISAQLARRGDHQSGIIVRITDNGRGFDPKAVQGGRGLGNLQQRAARIGAELAIKSAVGRGTSISLYLPLTEEPCREEMPGMGYG